MQNISESLKRQREQILEDRSEEALSRHTSLLEIAVISLYNRMVNRIGPEAEDQRSSGTVVALGAFGRGLIGPNQTLPILFLKSESFPWQESWLDEMEQPLAEAGWNVDMRRSTVDSLLDQARGDFPFFLHLLEARYVSGSRPLMERFDRALEGFMEGKQDEFLKRLFDDCEQRRPLVDDPENWLEPDLMETPGGLADIITIRAACRVATNIRNIEDAIFRGYLVRQEVDFLQQAEKTYVHLLNMLYNMKGGEATRMRFGDQELIAEKLGYTAPAGFLPVEVFMRHVQQLFHGVGCISREFWEKLHEGRHYEEEQAAPSREIESGLLERAGKIVLQPDRYPATAGHLTHLFALAAKHRLSFSNTTRQWIEHHRNRLDTAAGDPTARDEFKALLLADTPQIPLIRQFYDKGYMTSLLPELASVHNMVQHDAFHIYPVHEHHLRTVSELKRLMNGDYAQSEPELTRIATELDDPIHLLLAGLLHDVGKSAGREHPLRGSEMIPAIAGRLGLSPEEADTIRFLVAQHLLLNDSASMRDLADEEMLSRCSNTIETPERLDLLVLLSFAYLAATGPKALEKWREMPVLQLYEKIKDLMEKGEPSRQAIAERVAHIRSLVAQELRDIATDADLETHFSELDPRYLLSTSPSTIALHLRMEWELRQAGEPFISRVSTVDAGTEITLMSWDEPSLLSQTAGILTLHNMNIIGAQIFTKQNGAALLIFQCKPPEAEPDWQAIREDMIRLHQGKLALDFRIAARAADQRQRQVPARQIPNRVVINNEASAVYTILEVYTTDRTGLLYTIARTLVDLKVHIFTAKITTKVDQVADVFYIKTRHGEKVTDPEQMQEIKCALLFWLENPCVE